jgi:hypothetical protein
MRFSLTMDMKEVVEEAGDSRVLQAASVCMKQNGEIVGGSKEQK